MPNRNGEKTLFDSEKNDLARLKPFEFQCLSSHKLIDHFHKWRPIINSFVNIKVSLTNLILKLIIQEFLLSNEVSKANLNQYKRILN